MNVDYFRKILDQKLAEYNHARRRQEEEGEYLQEANKLLEDTKQAQKVVQEMAQSVQQAAHSRIASVVTRCLQTVFVDDKYIFTIVFEQKRGKTEARLVFTLDGWEVDPRDCGGVLDVASFALRLACLMLGSPKRRRLLILDEPFRMLDSTNASRLKELLLLLSKEMNVQIVMVTHNPGLRIGKVVELE